MRRRRLSAVLRFAIFVAFFSTAWPALAQEAGPISGQVLEAGTDRPISGATVLAHDPDGRRVAATFADSQGRFVLRIPGGVEVTLLAERIGYAQGEFGPLTAGARTQDNIVLHLDPRPLPLAEIQAGGEDRCETDPQQGAATYELWSDARTALRASVVTGEQELVHFRTRVWTRILNDRGQRLRTVSEQEVEALRQPFHTLDPDELARSGYVQVEGDTAVFFAPDADVLLSSSFASTHCFRIVQGGILRNRGLIGLGFEPVPGRTIADIRGTLWMDASSGELRRIEYEYVEDGAPVAENAGGRIELRALEDGPWIVDRWWIRTPVGGVFDESGRRITIRYQERGGAVTAVLGAMRS